MDIVGPLPISEECRYLFTIVDRSTGWPEAIPMKEATTETCVKALIGHWISRFGLPDIITSDRGSVFTSNLWSQISKCLGFSLSPTSAYNPEANGMVERFHRTLKAALMAKCTTSNWMDQLQWTLLGLRTVPKEPDGISAAEKVYGETLHVPSDFFFSHNHSDPMPPSVLHDKLEPFIPHTQTYKDLKSRYTHPDLLTSSHVFIRVDASKPPLTPPYTGPYKVLDRKPKVFKIQIRNKTDWISIDRLKPAYMLDNDQPDISFSRAGRPLLKGHRPP